MPYGTSADSYSSRVKDLLARNNESSLLYATLELRCGVEARMKEYLDPLEHIPKAHKKEYSVVKLGKAVDNAFQAKDQIAIFTICFPDGSEEISLRYIPVPKRLQDIAARAGDALHFPGEAKIEDPLWWHSLRQVIEEGSNWLAWVATGDLIGMPLLNRKTKQTSLRIHIGDEDQRSASLRRLVEGQEHKIKVAYEPVPKAPPPM